MSAADEPELDPADLAAPPDLSPRRMRTRKARFKEIREAAMAMISAGGLDALTVHRLADELDWAPGTLYRYFSSKEALVQDLTREVIDEVREGVHAHLDGFQAGKSPNLDAGVKEMALVVLSGLSYDRFAQTRPAQFRLIALELGDSAPALADDVAAQYLGRIVEVINPLTETIQSLQRGKHIEKTPAVFASLVYWIAVHSIVTLRKLERLGDLFNTRDALVRHAATTLRGWGADPAKVTKASRAAVKWFDKNA